MQPRPIASNRGAQLVPLAWALAIAVAAVACHKTQDIPRSTGSASPDRRPVASPSSQPSVAAALPDQSLLQSPLAQVAHCFHEAVSLLQAEPTPPCDLFDFLAKAQTARSQGKQSPPAACLAATLDNVRKRVLIEGTAEVRCEKGTPSRDEYDDGRTEWSIPYRFWIEGRDEVQVDTIHLSAGRGRSGR